MTPGKMTRMQRPAIRSEHHFSIADASTPSPGKMTRMQRPAVISEHTFEPCAVLRLTLRPQVEADAANLPLLAALLTSEISIMDFELGGRGFALDPEGIRKEGQNLTLRLISQGNVGSAERVGAIIAKLESTREIAKIEDNVRVAKLLATAQSIEAAKASVLSLIESVDDMPRQAA